MTQYNILNINVSNLQLNKLKFGIKSDTEITLKLSSNFVCDSNDENSFSHKLLLTNTQVSKLRKVFPYGLSAKIKIKKIDKSQSGELLDNFLGPLIKAGLPLIKNVLKPLAKSVLIPLGLTAVASLINANVWIWHRDINNFK